MAKVLIFGATGYTGGHVAGELEKRGHDIVRASRSGGDGVVKIDVTDPVEVKDALAEINPDVAIIAIKAFGDNENKLIRALTSILDSGVDVRLGVAGGAGSLQVTEGGPRVIDNPNFPEVYKAEATAQGEALEFLRTSDTPIDWFYVSPTAAFGAHAPAVEPTGSYRTQLDTLVKDSEGSSNISGEDYALAFADEIESPRHHRQRFAVGL
ncbi:NAD(P)-dependent oxidoreductase [Arthrobacter globiformis]|uniref:NAD(P)-dependent oxidoreductase n=1 Tax=Arthrobacter globiformis TaxID=1665 RepID=UPI00278157A7|nr:NAD(P)H-binding protein [Arthrobacter globiformis]MDQ0867345.1 putative NADH-flavin reductase [Arthrobacter globiformis]